MRLVVAVMLGREPSAVPLHLSPARAVAGRRCSRSGRGEIAPAREACRRLSSCRKLRLKNGNVTAQIFWLKTRARWRETLLQHSGFIGRKDLSELSDAELMSIVLSAGNDSEQRQMKTIDAEKSPSQADVRAFLRLVTKSDGE